MGSNPVIRTKNPKVPKAVLSDFLSIETGFGRERRSNAAGKRQVNLSFSATDRSKLQSTSMNLVEMLCKLQERVLLPAPNKNKTNLDENSKFVLFFTRDYFGLKIKL